MPNQNTGGGISSVFRQSKNCRRQKILTNQLMSVRWWVPSGENLWSAFFAGETVWAMINSWKLSDLTLLFSALGGGISFTTSFENRNDYGRRRATQVGHWAGSQSGFQDGSWKIHILPQLCFEKTQLRFVTGKFPAVSHVTCWVNSTLHKVG